MKSYRVAAVQMTSKPNLDHNLSVAEELIDLAVRQGADLVGLPENFSFLGTNEDKINQAATIAEKTQNFLVTTARKYQVTLLGGGFPVPASNHKNYNAAILISPDGEVLTHYEKAHLFDVNLPDGNTYWESDTVQAGGKYPDIYHSKDFGNLGLSVCYDVRFPELYRHLAAQEADVLFIPAAFTAYTGKDHWEILIRARAIENTCYVVAPAQTGNHYEMRYTHGHAMVVDPWGVILADAGTEPGLAIADINPERITQVRQQMPSLKHRLFMS
jgi:predicted amidohydrolase